VNLSPEEVTQLATATALSTYPRGRKKDSPEGRAYLKERGKLKRYDNKWDYKRFVAWDGEGWTDSTGRHHYFLLANSYGHSIVASEGSGLSTRECLRFLTTEATIDPHAIHVGFALGYDINKMLKDFCYSEALRIYQQQRCFWHEYKVEWLPGKRLYVRNRETKQAITLWDVFPFFQTSFVKTLERWNVGTEESRRYIQTNKNLRSSFTVDQLPSIQRYCEAELAHLVELMGMFYQEVENIGLRLRRWDGPGAIATAVFSKHNIKPHLDRKVPENVNRAAQYAYFGGRIEQLTYGHTDRRVYLYDINSAYPSVIAELPSLRGSTWSYHQGAAPPLRNFSLYHIRLRGDTDTHGAGPIPWRTVDGAVAFPPGANGWYWTPEYSILLDCFPQQQYEVLEAYLFQPGEDTLPFIFVHEYYQARLDAKREGRATERAYKLGLNSLYGKMVQQLGWSELRGIPPYHQLEWGGYVTSATRAKLYRAFLTAPKDTTWTHGKSTVIGFETDSILSLAQLDVTLSDRLGDWSCNEFDTCTYVQPGVYWLGNDDHEISRYRGFDRGSLSRSDVIEHYKQGTTKSLVSGQPIVAESTRFLGIGDALRSGRTFPDWGNWQTSPRELSLFPTTKRQSVPGKTYGEPLLGYTYAPAFPLAQQKALGYSLSVPYPLLWKGEPIPRELQEAREAMDSIYWED
jgi:hypothetical protein